MCALCVLREMTAARSVARLRRKTGSVAMLRAPQRLRETLPRRERSELRRDLGCHLTHDILCWPDRLRDGHHVGRRVVAHHLDCALSWRVGQIDPLRETRQRPTMGWSLRGAMRCHRRIARRTELQREIEPPPAASSKGPTGGEPAEWRLGKPIFSRSSILGVRL